MPFPRISTPVFVIPLDEGSILYFPLRKGAFLGNKALALLIRRWQQAPFEAKTPDEAAVASLLERMGVFTPDKDAAPKNPAAPAPPHHATLFATTRCNLNCTYCYAAPRHKGPDMDLPLAFAAIDFAAKNAKAAKKGFFSVSFHGGGEPTSNWRLIKGATLYAQKTAARLNLAPRLFMATNGILEPSQCRFLAENFEGLSVSFDGLEQIQNQQRPFKNGRPTYTRVLETLARLAEKGMPLGIRMTATRFSLPLLAQSAAFVAAKGLAKNIMVEPVFALGKGAQTGMETESESFAAAFLEASAAAGAYGATLTYSPARLEKLALNYCGAGAKNFCVMPGGQISACTEIFDPRIADAPFWTMGEASKKGLLLDDDRRENIALAIEAYKEKWCSQCFALWHCAGDCPRLALQSGGQNAPAPNPKRCQATKAILASKILEKINAS
ncbi:MAG: radical SAM protein, partial [Desulfatibacillaceae bacterium]|nr:radical SAM protein [Desulfatibacillaceae bacterium]